MLISHPVFWNYSSKVDMDLNSLYVFLCNEQSWIKDDLVLENGARVFDAIKVIIFSL